MDFLKVTAMLATAYWSPGIKEPEVKQGAANSALVLGLFYRGEQIGYCRAVSDKTRFAYIMDVFVDERYRKKGIGQYIVKNLMGHPDLKDVYQWTLITNDAHGVYSKLGFTPLKHPGRWMENKRERPDR